MLVTRQKLSLRSIQKELVLLLFAPVIVVVVCPLIFKEKLTGKQILCFAMATAGLVLITGTAGGGKQDLLGIAFGLAAAAFYCR